MVRQQGRPATPSAITWPPLPPKTNGEWNTPASIQESLHALVAAKPKLRKLPEFRTRYGHGRQPVREIPWYIQKFIDKLEAKGTPANAMSALDIRPFHVNEWLDTHPDWGHTYRHSAIASVKRA